MNALPALEKELRALGYQSLVRDYSFADVLSADGEERRVALAAFTQVPESYRSAAFGVIIDSDEPAGVANRRALGAPILFSIGESDIGVWRVGAEGAPRLLERVNLEALSDLFLRNAERWLPQAVHRAKSLGQSHPAYQLDFVDLGLLPSIEHEVQDKLDRLLQRVIEQLLNGSGGEREEAAFRTTFRLLAAKILIDREHPEAQLWRDAPVSQVLQGIGTYYNLDRLSSRRTTAVPAKSAAAAWSLLREAISFRNISSDSLAFVYENTLVTADTRKRFGTHNTPRQVAEFVVSRLDLGQFSLNDLTIYEPFTGAGTFLVAALRHLRDLLPEDWTGKQRHAFLVPRIRGAEIDAFACEVATLSLILADYPNANGWEIKSDDLFRAGMLVKDAAKAKVVFCNPPWEDFDADERVEYPEMALKSFSKPMAVLHAILDARPEGIGFVLPQGFLRQQQYAELRQRTAELYGRVELTSLPDRVFQRAGFEAALLIASERRSETSIGLTKLLSTIVEDRDRNAFLATGKVSADRRRTKVVKSGDLWIGQLDELWEYLQYRPTLGNVANIYRGLQWVEQSSGASASSRAGFARGVFKPADSLIQFEISDTLFLDMDPDAAKYPGPLTRPWEKAKILANAARISRGPWRLAAAYDDTGLVASQSFFGIWLTNDSMAPEALEAILNSPLASAFVAEHASNQHLTNELLKQLPLPKRSRYEALQKAVRRYHQALASFRRRALYRPELNVQLNQLLVEVDAEVLKAYDLPPRLERRLLEFFRGHERERRLGHSFDGWIPSDFTAYIPLHEYIGPLVEQNRGAWPLGVFTPAPEDEVAVFKRFVH